jgi:hypothetical protein
MVENTSFINQSEDNIHISGGIIAIVYFSTIKTAVIVYIAGII